MEKKEEKMIKKSLRLTLVGIFLLLLSTVFALEDVSVISKIEPANIPPKNSWMWYTLVAGYDVGRLLSYATEKNSSFADHHYISYTVLCLCKCDGHRRQFKY